MVTSMGVTCYSISYTFLSYRQSKLRADLDYGHPPIPGRPDKGGVTVRILINVIKDVAYLPPPNHATLNYRAFMIFKYICSKNISRLLISVKTHVNLG